MDTQNKKAVFIPGWLHSLNFYKKENGLDIWIEKESFEKEIEAPIIIGHSLGANFALTKYNQAIEKIILFNPVLGKKNSWGIFLAWLKHTIFEKIETDEINVMLRFPSSFPKVSRLMKADYENILQNIPSEKITVYHGVGDKYLCDQKCLEIFRKFGIKIIEVENADHNWSDVFDQEVEKIINN